MIPETLTAGVDLVHELHAQPPRAESQPKAPGRMLTAWPECRRPDALATQAQRTRS